MATKHETLDNFCSQLAAGTPAPGGGAAAAVAGAMGAALVSMVAGLTLGREKYADVQAEMAELQVAGRRELEALFTCADEDQTAFHAVMAAFALPKGTDEEKAQRQQAVQTGYKQATEAPIKTMEHGLVVMRAALAAAKRGNSNVLSDAYVAYLTAAASFEGALWNVAINLGSLKAEGYRQGVVDKVTRLRAERDEMAAAMQALTPDPVARFLART